jgi:hypothetical protein
MGKLTYDGKKPSGICDSRGYEVTLRRIHTTCMSLCTKDHGFDAINRAEILLSYVSEEYLC